MILVVTGIGYAIISTLSNEAFSFFDSLMDKYNVEKIRTIGDSYMVVLGVPRPRRDHAQALVRMALEMQHYAATHQFRNGHRLSFRIGINSGPVIGGVIGKRKFVYDVWGDAVNVASRMESHGINGTIQITQATYELIKDEFVCESRGNVNVKGKGDMEVWLMQSAMDTFSTSRKVNMYPKNSPKQGCGRMPAPLFWGLIKLFRDLLTLSKARA